MSGEGSIRFDLERGDRTGVPEAVFAAGKSADQIDDAVRIVHGGGGRLLLTRLSADAVSHLSPDVAALLDYDPRSRTAILGDVRATAHGPRRVCVVAAGTSDLSVAREATRTLDFNGVAWTLVMDVGVAGLWRLLERLDEIRGHDVVIAVAGMEGALFSVLGGLVRAPVIAVPTSVGYGVAADGRAALSSALASCAPGVVAVDVDNGFGAAAAAVKMLSVRSP